MAQDWRTEQLTDRQRYLVLAICCLSLLIVGLDTTIVNVALPSINRSLHASVSGLQRTIDAYTLVLASLLILSGSMADRLGRRRVFQTGLLNPVALSIIRNVFEEPRQRAQAIGLWVRCSA